jgi:hypothetical protein
MDLCAGILLGFPSVKVRRDPDNYELFDDEIKSHISKLEGLFKTQTPVVAANGLALLDVSDSPAVTSLQSWVGQLTAS